MKKSIMLAVVASMLVSANVAMAGFGVKVPGASKPAASSSQQQAAVDVDGLVTACNPITASLAVAYAKAIDAQLVFDELIGKVDPKVLELKKALENDSNKDKTKDVKGAASFLANIAKKSPTPAELEKANVEQGKVDAAFATSKKDLQDSYKLAGVAVAGAPALLKDASNALKSLKPTDSNFGKVKAVIDVCQLAGKYTSALGAYEKMIGGYKDYKTKKK